MAFTIPVNHPLSSSSLTAFFPELPFKSWKQKKPPVLQSPPRFRVSAHFRRRTGRQNYLRKKLTQQQVSLKPKFEKIPVREIVDNDSFSEKRSNLDDSNEVEVKSKSNLFDKLENWVEQYKKDVELWGVGNGAVFTVFRDSEGRVERVAVNEDEILRRCGEDDVVSERIIYAKSLAREMEENGNDSVLQNSSVAKFITSGEKNVSERISSSESLAREMEENGKDLALQNSVASMIEGVNSKLKPFLPSKLSTVGMMFVLGVCGVSLVLAVKKLFVVEESNREYTRYEKEMMRRKLKARMEKERRMKGAMEVVEDPVPVSVKRPELDKQELTNSIWNTGESSSEIMSNGIVVDPDKIQEIQIMARNARELEKRDSLKAKADETRDATLLTDVSVPEERSQIENGFDSDDSKMENGFFANEGPDFDGEDVDSVDPVEKENQFAMANENSANEGPDFDVQSVQSVDAVEKENQLAMPNESSVKKEFKVIGSVQEAREFLSKKRDNVESTAQHASRTMPEQNTTHDLDIKLESEHQISRDAEEEEKDYLTSGISNTESASTKIAKETKTGIGMENDIVNLGQDKITDPAEAVNRENWIEKNFHLLEPIVEKMGAGFRDNYAVARDKINQDLDLQTDLSQLMPGGDDDELEWMKDEKLRDIVFKVRDNELAGRDPFHKMDEQEKRAFFSGLEKKVEKVNTKLANLHEWVHSNVENLDYGADGISVYDSPEKVIPRWKGPPVGTIPGFLKNSSSPQRGGAVKRNGKFSPPSDGLPKDSSLTHQSKGFGVKSPKAPKIVIEGSDGSVRAGKRSGKEFWQHTKKWSEGFIESYNAEPDPEVKGVMKDIGKDLDRWITEKEIKEAAELMDKLPERGREIINEKINKVKREMQLFGPQAVASKYREYSEEKEEDYFWWLDLPYVLCIEMYTEEEGEQKVGFYSLEMAEDLEIEPKPFHVIAFEDAADSKNMCYIIQAHLEMLGKGSAFVIARPPKDAFREAKANGFAVTVIRKGEVKLNVDQTLEEVEELIAEIGSKVYHDAIMKERSVDIDAVMKGVFGLKKPTRRRRSKKKGKKPAKS